MGTSKGYIAPSTPNWASAKRGISGFINQPSELNKKDAVAKYARAMNSEESMYERASAVFASFSEFVSSSNRNGISQALSDFGKKYLNDLSPEEAFSELVNSFSEGNVSVPVIELETWNSVRDDINKMLSYLSGDEWNFNFRESEPNSNYRSQKKTPPHRPEHLDTIRAISLFSGGLDSFCGAHKLLSENTPTIFVGFQEYGPLKGLQNELIGALQSTYQESKCDLFTFTAVARSLFLSDNKKLKSENTSRSRSFLFLCAALTVAGIVGDGIPVYIPENGFIGLNLPMTPGRLRGLVIGNYYC